MINNCIKNVLNWIIPQRCPICKQFLHNSNCGNKSIENNPAICHLCEQILPVLQNGCAKCCLPISTGELCGKCLSTPPYFDIAHCVYQYQFPIDKIIHQFKYADKVELAKPLANMMVRHIQQYRNTTTLPELLIAVPLHPLKLKQRGFNQALELTKYISKLTEINYVKQHVIKAKVTPPQASLNLKKRHKAVRNSFQIKQTINAKHIAIIDDVMTSGATTSELARILKRDGVKYVEVWCLARA